MAKLADIVKALFAEPVETIAEGLVEKSVDELQGEFDELVTQKADELLAKLQATDKLSDEAKLILGVIGETLKAEVAEALVDGANDVIAYVWEKVQEINKGDATSAAPTLAAPE